jgi:phytoene desaturase
MQNLIAIIGAGIAGMATALRLSQKGFTVHVFEKNATAGGKMAELFRNDFRFDTGPSLLTFPELLVNLFNYCEEDLNKYIKLVRLGNICRYIYPDGTIVNAYSSPQMFAGELSQKTGIEPGRVEHFLKENQFLFDLTAHTFLFSPFQKMETFLTPEARNIGRNIHKLHFLQKMHNRNYRIFRNNKVTQLFDRYATYNGSNPYKAPATLNMIAHLEHNIGAYLPEKGMYSIVEGMIRLAEKKQISIHFNSAVSKILIEKGKVKGIMVNKQFRKFDVIVDTCDINYSQKRLSVNSCKLKLLKPELSMSALIFFWGIRGSYPQLDVHNILFSANYRTEFNYLFKKFNIYSDPTIYIYISSKINPADAPKKCENWFVMVNAPNNRGQDWKKIIERTREVIIRKISKSLELNIESCIVSEDVLGPKSIESMTNSWKGALYGASSNSIFSAFSRHPNFSRKYKRLYYAGGTVHPGGGIPLCLASAKIVSDLVQKDIENLSE